MTGRARGRLYCLRSLQLQLGLRSAGPKLLCCGQIHVALDCLLSPSSFYGVRTHTSFPAVPTVSITIGCEKVYSSQVCQILFLDI